MFIRQYNLQLHPSQVHALIFLQNEAIVSLLLITSGMLFQSMLPLKHKDFMPKVVVDVNLKDRHAGHGKFSVSLFTATLVFLTRNSL